MSAAQPDREPTGQHDATNARDAEDVGAPPFPQQDRRRMVDLTRVEAGEPERRAAFRRFTEDTPED